MNSITLLIIEAIICFIVLIIIYAKYKINGLYLYAIVLAILSSLMSLKQIPIDNYDINLGIIPFIMIFTISNIIIQRNKKNIINNIINFNSKLYNFIINKLYES